MSEITAVVIRGDFSVAEYAEIIACIRRLDDSRPDARFEIVAVDPATTAIETAESMLREAVPPLPGRQTDFTTISFSMIAAAPDLLAVVKNGLSLKGGWREAIVELEDFCSERVRLKNMLAAANQLDDWADVARVAIAKAEGR